MKLTKQRLREIIKEEIINLREGKMVQWEIKDRDKRKVSKILDKLRLKMGKNYDFGASRHGATFVLELDKKFEDKVLELFIKNRINVQGA
jgi:hypothetical protein